MSPVDYSGQSEFAGYIDGMQALELASISTRAEADEALSEAAPNRTVRSFLLQTLRRDSGGEGWRWMPNLDLRGRELPVLGGWHESRVGGETSEGRGLWVGEGD